MKNGVGFKVIYAQTTEQKGLIYFDLYDMNFAIYDTTNTNIHIVPHRVIITVSYNQYMHHQNAVLFGIILPIFKGHILHYN